MAGRICGDGRGARRGAGQGARASPPRRIERVLHRGRHQGSLRDQEGDPPNIDADIDFGIGVTLFEIVNKHMSLQARSGDMAAFKTAVDQAVITKAG